MVWSSPPIALAGASFSASEFNEVIDSFKETAAAKATSEGGYFVGSGFRTIAARHLKTRSDSTDRLISSTTFTDVDDDGNTIGPVFTGTVSSHLIVTAQVECSTSSGGALAFSIDGPSTYSPNEFTTVSVRGEYTGATGNGYGSQTFFLSMLTPGDYTFRPQLKSDSGTSTFYQITIAVMEF